jgi:hypothetical protein
LRELALHLLDIAENSVAAKAKNITITVKEDIVHDRLFMSVEDDGTGMDAEMAAKITDPFVTSRKTRKVGLGIPLLKEAAEACNGFLKIESKLGKGTLLSVEFQRSHIDRMPLGDLATTIYGLVVAYPDIHFKFDYKVDKEEFNFDDAPIKAELKDVPLTDPLVLSFLRELLESGVSNISPAPATVLG